MGRSLRSVLIAAGVLAALGIILAVVLITAPKEENSSSSLPIDFGWDEDDGVNITKHFVDSALRVCVKNSEGEFEILRDSRTNADGKEEYFWKTDALGNVVSDELQLKYFVETFAGLVGESVVEEGTENLSRYGLDSPMAVVELDFDDGLSTEVDLGIRNPLKDNLVYCRYQNTVYLVDYSAVEKAFHDARSFAELILTEAYNEDTGYPEYIKIERRDNTEPVELELIEARKDIDDTVLKNSYRLKSPFSIELDSESGGKLYSGLCGLMMNACEFLEKSEQNLAACGLDDPAVRVSYKYNGKESELLIGNKCGDGYYAALSGTDGIFSIAESRAPWVGFNLFTVISKRPVGAYIYHCESIDVILPEEELRFTIDDESKLFYMNGREIPSAEFKELYTKLTGSFGEELYLTQTDGAPVLTVRFNYKSDCTAIYGGSSDTLSFNSFDGRKYAVNFNGKTIFKVSEITVNDLVESVKALGRE